MLSNPNSRLLLRLMFVAFVVSVLATAADKKPNSVNGFVGKIETIAPEHDPEHTRIVIYKFRFDKNIKVSNGGCLTDTSSWWGKILTCHIQLPDSVSGKIVGYRWTCLAPCSHTLECPGGNACVPGYPNPTNPLNLAVDKPRAFDWYGWTNDGNSRVLAFDVYVEEIDKP